MYWINLQKMNEFFSLEPSMNLQSFLGRHSFLLILFFHLKTLDGVANDSLPVYSLSPIDMVITIRGTRLPPPPLNVHKRLAHKSLGGARGTASIKSVMYLKRHQLNAPDIVKNFESFKVE